MNTAVATRVAVVIPTIGRRSLQAVLGALAEQAAVPEEVVVVDDRPDGEALEVPADLAERCVVLRSGGRGPAAARNLGWRRSTKPWVVFLDDDVVPTPDWSERLVEDLEIAGDVGATQARIVVPRPAGRLLTDRERNIVALETAPWITADLAVRRRVLERTGGFDERFPRAYREDSDFALRAEADGWRFVVGARVTEHPLRPGPWWASVPAQRGNRDDARMRAIHGAAWSPPSGRRRRHGAITAAAALAVAGAAFGARRLVALAGLAWVAGTIELALARIRPGPRTTAEISAMVATSIAIPPVATWHWVVGRAAHRPARTRPWGAEDGWRR